jgi:3-oxoacyl-[acyl-carrier protein] reductase
VAIVTGAAQGIGAATALKLAADGHRVAVLDLDASKCDDLTKAIVSSGGQAIAIGADVGDVDAVNDAVAGIAATLGPPTILVNNAGITRDNLVFKMTESDWDSVMTVHLRGAFLIVRAVQGYMTNARWGRIVSLSSVAALGNRGQANYSTAKAGLQGLTKTLAIELGPFQITANAVAPGFIATEMTRTTAERINVPWVEFVSSAAERIPVRRIGTPEDVAAAVSFLASEAAGFISEQVLYVAGEPRG